MARAPRIKHIETGTRFGKWTVGAFSHIADTQSRMAYWNVVCDCGTKNKVEGASLRKGITTMCRSCQGHTQEHHLKYHHNNEDLYMLKCGPYIKIGATNNIKQRLTQIRANCPYEVLLVGYWKGEGHRERSWHDALHAIKVRGEWFLPDATHEKCSIG